MAMKRRASLMVASAYGIAPREVALNSLLCCFVTCTAHSKLQLCGFRLVTSIVAHVSTTKQTTAGTSFRHRLCTDAHHTIAHAHICAPVQAKGCMHNGGGAQSSAESNVRFYLALFLAQFSKHLWLLLQYRNSSVSAEALVSCPANSRLKATFCIQNRN